MKLRYLYILFSFLISSNLSTDDVYDTSWALVIGINNYEFIEDLPYSVDDAIAIKNMLINHYDFPRENVTVLLDGDADAYKIKKEFSKIKKQMGENDRFVFYFAGLGDTETVGRLEDEKQAGYLMPVDGDLEDLYLTAIPMEDLKRIANSSKAKHMLFMVDACYGGLAAENSRGLIDVNAPNYIEVIAEDVSRQIITAGSADQVVISKDEWEHSAFTKNIISGLREESADRDLDGIITGSELGNYITQTVMLDTENSQLPQSRRLTVDRGEIIFIPPAKIKKEDNEIEQLQNDLQALINAMQETQTPAKKTSETVILPGYKGLIARDYKEFLVEDVILTSEGLQYRGKAKLAIGMDESASWSPTFSISISEVYPVEGQKTGQYNYATGEIE